MTKILAIVGLTALLSCAGAGFPLKPSVEILIDGLIIQNLTEETIHDFVLKIENVKNDISVTPILNNNSFSTSFPLRTYQSNEINMTWLQGGRQWTSGPLKIDPPADLVPGRPATVMILIRENGNVITTLRHLLGESKAKNLQDLGGGKEYWHQGDRQNARSPSSLVAKMNMAWLQQRGETAF